MLKNSHRNPLGRAVRYLPIAIAFVMVIASVGSIAKIGLKEKGGSQYTITVDGTMLTDANGAPKLYTSLDAAVSVAEIYLQNDPDADVVITGIQHYEADLTTRGRKNKGNQNDSDPVVDNPTPPEEPATPEEPTVEDPAPQDPAPEDPAVEDPAGEDPAAEDPMPEDPAAEDPAPEDPAAEDPAPQDPAANDPAAEDPAAENPVPEDPVIDEPAVLEPPIAFTERPISAPVVELSALIDGATTYWVSPSGIGDGLSADHPTTLTKAVATIDAAGGGHYVIRLANGERHTLVGAWPSTAKGASADKPVVLMPATPQGKQPIVIGFSGAAGIEFESPRHVVVHGIQFGSHLGDAVKVVMHPSDADDCGITFDGCTMFGSVHGLTITSKDGVQARANAQVINCLIADHRSSAIVASTVSDVRVIDSFVAYESIKATSAPAIDVVAGLQVELTGNAIARSGGAAVRVKGGTSITVSDNAFVGNVSAGELCNNAASVEWTGNVIVNGADHASAAGLRICSSRALRVVENLFVNSHSTGGPAIQLGRAKSVGDENVSSVLLMDNIVYDTNATAIAVNLLVADEVVFNTNTIQSSTTVGKPSVASKWLSADAAPGIYSHDDRFALATQTNAIQVGDQSGGYDVWRQLTGGAVQTAPVRFVDPTRDAAMYNRVALEGEESAEALAEAIRAGSIETAPLVEWIRAGFQVVSIESEPETPPSEPEVPQDPPTEPEQPPVEPEDPPVVPQEPENNEKLPVDATIYYVDAPGGGSAGDDKNDGLTPETAVATLARARELLHGSMVAEQRNVWVVFRRGDVWSESWGINKTINPDNPEHIGSRRSIQGVSDTEPLVVAAYGDGAPPEFHIDGSFWIKITEGDGYLEFRGLRVVGDGRQTGLWVHAPITHVYAVDCEFDGAWIHLNGGSNDTRANDIRIVGSVIHNMINPVGVTGDLSGMFCDRIDNLRVESSVFDLCGWNRLSDGSLEPDTRNHGIYINGRCGPATVIDSVFTRNAGAGLQMRSGGDISGSFFAGNGLGALNWGWMRTNNNDSVPDHAVSGSVRNNVIHHSGGTAMRIGNIASGIVESNTIASDNGLSWGDAVNLDALANDRFNGISNLTFRGNTLRSIRHGILLSGGGWNNVVVENNTLDTDKEPISEWSLGTATENFSDPKGQLKRQANELEAQLPDLRPIVVSDEMIEDLMSGKLSAADLVLQYKAH